METPDLQTCQAEVPKSSAKNIARFGLPEFGWTLFAGVVRPKSRGRLRLTGPKPLDPLEIQANMLSHPDDLTVAVTMAPCVVIGERARRSCKTSTRLNVGRIGSAAIYPFRTRTTTSRR